MTFRIASAGPTGLPRTTSATRRHFCGEIRAWRSLAKVCMALLRRRLAVAAVRFEGARRSELAELVPYHVLGHQHRHVIAAVVDRDRQTDHLGRDHRAAGPGLNRAAVVLCSRDLHLLRERQIDERTFLQ